MGRLDRPRAVVTGAGSGLGRALCLEIARRGGKVVASDVRLQAAQETAAMCGGVAVACDVTRPEQVEALAVAAERALGAVDLVVNNAGIATSGLVGEVSLEDWRRVVDVNLWGVVHGCHAFVPRLRRQGHGHVLNVASLAGLVSAPTMGTYNATKAAVVSLSETLYAELVDDGIGVSVLCPSFFRTNIHQDLANERAKAMADKMMTRSRLSADDVARIALDGCVEGRLYVLPHREGRVGWWLKRALPAVFARLAQKGMSAQARRFGIQAP